MSDKYIEFSGPIIGGKRKASFIPAEDLNCDPPYIKGLKDSCWVFTKGIDCRSKKACEKAVGMELLPLKEDA